MQLTTEDTVVVDLEHAVDVMLKFYAQSGEEVDWVQAHEMSISAAHKYVLLAVFFFSADRESTSNLLITNRLN